MTKDLVDWPTVFYPTPGPLPGPPPKLSDGEPFPGPKNFSIFTPKTLIKKKIKLVVIITNFFFFILGFWESEKIFGAGKRLAIRQFGRGAGQRTGGRGAGTTWRAFCAKWYASRPRWPLAMI